jgi:hypothetical protein
VASRHRVSDSCIAHWNFAESAEPPRGDGANVSRDLSDNPFRGLADAAVSSVQIEWGWAVLLAGAVSLVASALLKEAVSTLRKPLLRGTDSA